MSPSLSLLQASISFSSSEKQTPSSNADVIDTGGGVIAGVSSLKSNNNCVSSSCKALFTVGVG